jgi:acetyltransferase-like isoleucine patch superfamily enzyme
MYEIHAKEVNLGRHVVIEDGVVISGKSSREARRVDIGDCTFIGHNTRIAVDDLEIGDYVVLHNHSLITGNKPCKIGHCCWFGQNTILNSEGGLTIGRGVGVGAYSQLWTHIAHGDTLQGCLWNKEKPLVVEDDVWFVGHCIVAPIIAREKSMALVGSVVTKDMESNHIYAGIPAQDVTQKLGTQFKAVTVDEKLKRLKEMIEGFHTKYPQFKRGVIKIASSCKDETEDGCTIFDVPTRTYNKQLTEAEISFMKFLLPTIKFFPR